MPAGISAATRGKAPADRKEVMNAKILIADDDASVRPALAKVLRGEGYDVVLAESGQVAMEKITGQPIDLLVLDLGMPLTDGWGLLQWLAEFNPLLPVIVITGRWKQSDRAEAAGADALMEKPLDVPRLLDTIRELLAEPRDTRAQRIDRKRPFQSVACDSRRFRAGLADRYLLPFHFDATLCTKNN